MFKYKYRKILTCKGFTLVELLLVLVVASGILALVFVQLRGAKTKERDVVREQNMQTIQSAVSLYFNSEGNFPVCPSEVIINGKNDCLSQSILEKNLASSLPVDPIGGSSGECGGVDSYVYCYRSDGEFYSLRYRLETDSIDGKSAGWQNLP